MSSEPSTKIGPISAEVVELLERIENADETLGPNEILSAMALAYAYVCRTYGVTEEDARAGLANLWPVGVETAEGDMADAAGGAN